MHEVIGHAIWDSFYWSIPTVMIWIAGMICANWCYSCKTRLDAYLLARAASREAVEREAAAKLKRESAAAEERKAAAVAQVQAELDAERRRAAQEREAMERSYQEKLDAARRAALDEAARRQATEEAAAAQSVAAAQQGRRVSVVNQLSSAVTKSKAQKEKMDLQEANEAQLAQAEKERAHQLRGVEMDHAAQLEATRQKAASELQAERQKAMQGHQAMERSLQAVAQLEVQLRELRQAAAQAEVGHAAMLEADRQQASEQREAMEHTLLEQLEAARLQASEEAARRKIAEANMEEALRVARSEQEEAAWIARQESLTQLIEKRYAALWNVSWSEIQLEGFVTLSSDTEVAAVKKQLGTIISKYFPIVLELYLSHSTTVEAMLGQKDKAQSVKKQAKERAAVGEIVNEGEGGFAFGWEVQMQKKSWLNFCDELGSSILDRKKAMHLFAVVNKARDKRVAQQKIEALYRGVGTLLSQDLMNAADMALASNTFSLSEFLEACVRCAVIVPAVDNRIMDPSAKMKEAVIAMFDDWLLPYAARIGIRGFRDNMNSSPEMKMCKLNLATSFARMFEQYATTTVINGSKLLGVPLRRFLQMAEVADVSLSRRLVKTAYVQSLGLDAVSSAQLSGAKLLTEETLWEALLRLALLTCANEAGGAQRFTLAAMNDAQRSALYTKLETIVTYIGGPQAEATASQISAVEAAKALQAVARGMAARKKPVSKPTAAARSGSLLA